MSQEKSMDTQKQPKPVWGMVVDVERCIGCHACSVACKVENSVSLGNFRTKVYYYDHEGKNAIGRTALKRAFLPTLCMHCEDAPCLKACPTTSISRGQDGVVRIDSSTCDSSGDCISACPYGAIHIDPLSKVADKCDWCSHRLEVGMEPACVEVCPAEVFTFGDLNDPKSRVSQMRASKASELTVLKPQEGAKPGVKYRGIGTVAPREMENKLPKGRNHDPFTYEVDTWSQLRSDYGTAAAGKA
jgi:tetrathionate reductase subunit B